MSRQFLVACLDWDEYGNSQYYLTTRTVFTSKALAEHYITSIASERKPIIIEAVLSIPTTLRTKRN